MSALPWKRRDGRVFTGLLISPPLESGNPGCVSGSPPAVPVNASKL